MGLAIAALWGFAEATLFFLVADIWLTRLVITEGWRQALKAAVVAAFGALLGGVCLVYWSMLDAQGVVQWVEAVPAISQAMMRDAAVALDRDGSISLIPAAFTGVPYKIFAAQVYHSEASLVVFMLATVPARLLRFVLAIAVVQAVLRLLGARFPCPVLLRVWGIFWVVFYALFLSLMPG